MGRTSVHWILFAAVVLGTAAVHRAMPAEPRAAKSELFVPRPEVAKATALGFDAVVADYYWLRAVQIVGGSDLPEQEGRILGPLIDVVTTLDPWVDHPYRFAAVWLTESEPVVRQANFLLRRGTEYHPDDWRNHFHLGFNHFFYLNEPEEAAEALEAATELPGAPLYLSRLVARLKSQQAGLEVAETFLRQLVKDTSDPYQRVEYEKALDEVTTERRARILDRAQDAFRARHGRDLTRVEELLEGDPPILRRLPPEPHGWEWILDPATGRILSSYLRHRYEPKLDPGNQQRLQGWRKGEAEAAEKEDT